MHTMTSSGAHRITWISVRRHFPFLLLLAVLIWHCSTTFGIYVRGDDITWVARSVADARKPWNIFGQPVFGNYARPVVNAIWLINWYLWGFNFFGYQLTLCLIWLAGIVLLYGAGCKLGGRTAGFTAAMLVGLNDIHMLLPTWKSWFTALSELALLTGWLWCYREWFDNRKRSYLLGWAALAALAIMSKETAPLVIAAGVFATLVWRRSPGEATDGKGRPKTWARLLLWAIISAGVLALLPAYRGMLTSVFGGGATEGTQKAFSLEYFGRQFRFHAGSILSYGIGCPMMLFAAAARAWHALKLRDRAPRRYLRAMLGALIICGILLSLPAVAAIWGDGANAFASRWLWPGVAAVTFSGLILAGLAGDRWDRLSAVWFLTAMGPALFFYKSTNAYHMAAFFAAALFVGRAVAQFAQEEVLPAWRRIHGPVRARPREVGRAALLMIFLLVCTHQGWMLYRNFHRLHLDAKRAVMPRRVAFGRMRRATVARAMRAVIENAAPDRRVWVAGDGLERLAALQLQVEHGFKPEYLVGRGERRVGLRRFDSPLRVYTDAIPFDRDLFAGCNLLARFQSADEVTGVLRPGGKPPAKGFFTVRGEPDRPRNLVFDSPPFRLAAGAELVFGGFMRCRNASARRIGMAILSEDSGRYAVRTPSLGNTQAEWRLLWECAAPSDVSARFVFRVIEALQARGGEVDASDVFICPVDPLIEKARANTRALP